MAALKEGSGTVPGGYAKLRSEHQGDLADCLLIVQLVLCVSDLLIQNESNAQMHFPLFFCLYNRIQI
jgi:hypothetical protein